MILEHSLDVFSALRRASNSQYFCLFVVVLQLKESKVHTSDTGVRTVLSYVALEVVPELIELEKDMGSI